MQETRARFTRLLSIRFETSRVAIQRPLLDELTGCREVRTGHRAIPLYTASKHAVISITRSMGVAQR